MVEKSKSSPYRIIAVVDRHGDYIEGAYKTSGGSIVFVNEKELNSYLKKKDAVLKQKDQIDMLTKQVEELKKLLENKNG